MMWLKVVAQRDEEGPILYAPGRNLEISNSIF